MYPKMIPLKITTHFVKKVALMWLRQWKNKKCFGSLKTRIGSVLKELIKLLHFLLYKECLHAVC